MQADLGLVAETRALIDNIRSAHAKNDALVLCSRWGRRGPLGDLHFAREYDGQRALA